MRSETRTKSSVAVLKKEEDEAGMVGKFLPPFPFQINDVVFVSGRDFFWPRCGCSSCCRRCRHVLLPETRLSFAHKLAMDQRSEEGFCAEEVSMMIRGGETVKQRQHVTSFYGLAFTYKERERCADEEGRERGRR